MKRLTPLFILAAVLMAAEVALANPLKDKFEAATKAFQEGDYHKAIALYDETLKIHPKFAPSYYYLGLAHKKINSDASKVLWLFEKAVEFDPEHAYAYDQLGKISYAMARFDDAEKYSRKAFELNPKLVSSELTLAWTYLLGKSEPQEAIPYFAEVAEKFDLPYAHLGLGMAYLMSGQRIEVMEMVTDLRRKGEDELAIQLEDMIREGKDYQPTLPGIPAFSPKRRKGTLVKDSSPQPLPSKSPVQNIPVRLSGKMDGSYEPASPSTAALTAEERIRALQRRSQNLSKGSGY